MNRYLTKEEKQIINKHVKRYSNHFILYANVKQLCSTPETNITLYTNYISIKKRYSISLANREIQNKPQ